MRNAVIIVIAVIAVVEGCRGSRIRTAQPGKMTISLDEDTAITRQNVLTAVPIGTEIDEAKLRMEEAGFECSFVEDAKAPTSLYCAIHRTWKWPVARVWHVIMVSDEGRVKDVEVTTGLLGP